MVPVPAPSRFSDGKRPVIRWAQYQQRIATRAEMVRWFDGEPTNYAVVTGRVSGIVVVDIDDSSALPWAHWNLDPTPWAVKTSRGFHWYFRCSGAVGNRARIAGMKLDVRGDGGYVIGPGSIHSSGFKYAPHERDRWRAPKSQLPILDVAALANPPKRPARRPWVSVTGSSAERARKYLARMPTPIAGHGSDGATYVAACRLVRGFGLSASDAVSLLSEWVPLFDTWWLEKKVSAALRYGSEITGSKL